ncbi:hypothetical protein AV540_04435 [Brevibacillus parabrevis]|uniref:hypothetical protein n=1 Tax=Brevibacillus parabrevis TaxID=54914 RepID=UPI0007AC1E12|nr:hypothetical protein [Brevibacillus parabrevis]KZE55748.1 hypothetical protein AV540_04435 [Brevibacillus parabrevis]
MINEDILSKSCTGQIFRQSYHVREIGCQFITNSYEHFDWAEQYFEPYYEKDNNRINKINYSVTSIVDSRIYDQYIKQADEYPYNFSKSHHYKQAKLIDMGEKKLLIYEDDQFLIMLDSNKNHFYLLSNGLVEDVRFEPARIIREIFTRELEKQGFFLMHAAVVEKEGKSYLFCGNKGAGKTTTLIGLMNSGYNIVTNDRVFIGIEGTQILSIGWPGAVAITLETMLLFPKLKEILPSVRTMRFPQRRLDEEIDLTKHDLFSNDKKNKVDLTPSEISAIFGVEVKKEAILDQIIILGGFNEELQNEKTRSKEIVRLVRENLLYPEDPSYPVWFNMRSSSDEIDNKFNSMFSKIICSIPLNIFQPDKAISVERRIREIEEYLK